MANPEWGAKHICHSCGTRYYDLQRSQIICPKCNTEYDPEAFLKSRRTRAAAIEDLPATKAAAKRKTEAAAVVVQEPKEVAEVEVEADADTAALEELDKADDAAEPVPDADDSDDDDDDADVLLEDASELGDDDVGAVVDIGKKEDPNA